MPEDKPITEFELPDFREITEDGRRLFIAVQVKHNGIWRIHKNDPDMLFPSDLHADRVDAAEKLDIYSGVVYSSRTKDALYTLPKKAMRYIYNELLGSKEEKIVNCLKEKERFSYLN